MFSNYENNPNDRRWIVGYARVSTKEQADGFSIVNQDSTITRVAETLGESLKKIYRDEKSAYKETVKRQEFDEMIEMVKSNKIKVIIIWKSDRLIRNFIKSENINRLLVKHDVTLISATECLDFTTADGRKEMRKKSVDNQYESERTSERTMASLIASAKLGNYPKAILPLGYRRSNTQFACSPIVKDDSTYSAVLNIFQLVSSKHWGVPTLLKYLNSAHYMGRHWSEKGLYLMLENRIYIGTYINNTKNQMIMIPNHTEGIIPEDLFYAVQDIIHSRRYANKYDYYYKGYIFCKKCNCAMIGSSAHNGKSSFPFLYYYCNKCKSRINQSKLEIDVEKEFDSKIAIDYKLELIVNLQDKIKKIDKMLNMLEDDYLNGVVSDLYFEQKHHDFVCQKGSIERNLEKAKSLQKVLWRNMNYESRREWLSENVFKMYFDFTSKLCVIIYIAKKNIKENKKK